MRCLSPRRALVSIRPEMKSMSDIFKRLEDLGVDTITTEHEAVYTVEEAKAARGDMIGAHSKNLFLKDKKQRLWLVVCLEDRAVDMKDLRHRIGAGNLSFGKPDLLMEILGIEPGSVSPFALINDEQVQVNVVLDQEMMAAEFLNFHPLENTRTTRISPDGLRQFIGSCGHDPQIVQL